MSEWYRTEEGYFVNGADDRLSNLPESDEDEEEDRAHRCSHECRTCFRFQSGMCNGD